MLRAEDTEEVCCGVAVVVGYGCSLVHVFFGLGLFLKYRVQKNILFPSGLLNSPVVVL